MRATFRHSSASAGHRWWVGQRNVQTSLSLHFTEAAEKATAVWVVCVGLCGASPPAARAGVCRRLSVRGGTVSCCVMPGWCVGVGVAVYVLDRELVVSPTDLTRFLACAHSTSLDLLVARGVLEPPAEASDDVLQALFERGLEHEAAYL